MTTFSRWLEMQNKREDPVGEAARIWAAAGQTGDRPKVHSPSGVANWFTERFSGQPDVLAAHKEALEQAIQDKRAEDLGQGRHLAPVPDSTSASWRSWVEASLASALRSLGRIELALGTGPVEGTVPPSPLAQAFAAGENVTEAAAAGGVPWGRLWAVADHAAEAE